MSNRGNRGKSPTRARSPMREPPAVDDTPLTIKQPVPSDLKPWHFMRGEYSLYTFDIQPDIVDKLRQEGNLFDYFGIRDHVVLRNHATAPEQYSREQDDNVLRYIGIAINEILNLFYSALKAEHATFREARTFCMPIVDVTKCNLPDRFVRIMDRRNMLFDLLGEDATMYYLDALYMFIMLATKDSRTNRLYYDFWDIDAIDYSKGSSFTSLAYFVIVGSSFGYDDLIKFEYGNLVQDVILLIAHDKYEAYTRKFGPASRTGPMLKRGLDVYRRALQIVSEQNDNLHIGRLIYLVIGLVNGEIV